MTSATTAPNRARIQIAKPDILKFFDQQPQKIFRLGDLDRILSKQRSFWRLAQSTRSRAFVTFLMENARLRRLDFPFPYRKERRYVWGDTHLLEVLLTLKKDSYFTHYTAVRIHGLTEQVPKTIYLNHEQGPHNPDRESLTQSSIDLAFRSKPRVSQNIVDFDDKRVCLLNGMYTNQLGVINQEATYDTSEKARVRVTNIERTLIDITVRPVYAGGVQEVLKAYELAKETGVSVNRLAATLQQLGYVYPYHQAIGFYLERAGYKKSDLSLLERFPMKFDFFLTHQMKERDYVKRWHLHVPKSF